MLRKGTLGKAELGAIIRITENNLLDTAAAAIVQRMTSRRRPFEFLPVAPFNKGDSIAAVMVGVVV